MRLYIIEVFSLSNSFKSIKAPDVELIENNEESPSNKL